MAPKVIPGAPPPLATKSKKKAKKPSSEAAPAAPNTAAPVANAASAALIEQSPAGPTEVAPQLKVSSNDLADEAEKHTAIAAVDALESSSTAQQPATPPPGKPERSAIQTLITKRSTAVRKKLQRVQAYQHLDKSQLNPDQVRNLTAKPTYEALHSELQELGRGIDAIEREEKEAADARVADAKIRAEQAAKDRILLLLQFLHLFNLYFPNQARDPTFAPTQQLPAALQNATGQQVAALGKLFDQLANGPLQGGHGDALEILASIEAGSQEEVLPDVSYATVRSMILKLTAPPAEAEEAADVEQPAPLADAGETAAATSPVAKMNFMQADEVGEDAVVNDTVPSEANLDQGPEPEGGAPEPVPAAEAATAAGEEAGQGIVMGSEEATDATADGTAAAAVEEPINQREVEPRSETEEPNGETSAAATATPGKAAVGASTAESGFNWADDADDGDLPEAPVFPSLSSASATQSNTPAESSTPALDSSATTAANSTSTPAAARPSNDRERKPRDGQAGGRGGGGGARAGQRNGRGGGGQGHGARAPAPKPQPVVDEDGFTLQESKRSRMLAQQQQRRQDSSRGRGGRGGSGSGARMGRGGASAGGAGGSPRQSNGEGVRGKAPRRGRAAAPEGANASAKPA
ncbi:uncharacterized protein PFL1_03852 [Pseudozyma flocculosa PF-1]|uniref:Uncharacterized protein n=2 Tax=Pseudozyma flocculosa TaxID=84751 RepID=A0A5C3EXI1_9BASI|nr:uncharacterized protein PFL1_03852 [Pseudozyma flocculosa PF-1]EPQ28548.1 hypothetical protein PFL1_03852 [Pseudozyma flocculosa PF-1]SPO36475.1 uncharacterized protein PSFLO_01946 [Pseudozyma flocculosa]